MQIKRAPQHACVYRVRRCCSEQVSATCILLLALLLGKGGGCEEFSIIITKKTENFIDRLKAGRSRVRFTMMLLEFFIDIILPAFMDLGWTQRF
jgi:hypothetical protein